MPEIDLTLSVVSYNTKDLLDQCLGSVFRNTQGLSFEVIVVDNASQDGSADMAAAKYPQARLIRNRENLFFGRAHNQSAGIARGRYFAIVNSDLKLEENAFGTLVKFLDAHPEAGAAGPRILNADGTLQGSADRLPTCLYGFFEILLLNTIWPSNPVRARRVRPEFARDRTGPAETLSGACMAVRASLLKTVGPLDEGFVMYWEEVDWCKRILDAGHKIFFVAEASVFHLEGGSVRLLGREKKEAMLYASLLYYYRKHFGRPLSWALKFLLHFYTLPLLKVARAFRRKT